MHGKNKKKKQQEDIKCHGWKMDVNDKYCHGVESIQIKYKQVKLENAWGNVYQAIVFSRVTKIDWLHRLIISLVQYIPW